MKNSANTKNKAQHKPLPARKSDISSKKHKFEPFSHRIARIRIDPVRRPDTRNVPDADLSSKDSYFRSALDSWLELNLSEQFNSFSKEVDPLCDSLPQIIYHEDQIAEILISHLQRGTAVSFEPILELVAHFAHDLGPRFEKHFSRTVEVVTRIAASNPEIEVIEWSFNCLARLFKYLSKLLVPDLRPLFDLIAPLFGQQRQKEFVTRFAAESFSFLIRRASVVYLKDKKPLQRIVRHIFESVVAYEGSQTSDCYRKALSITFSEAIKGVNGQLSSNGDLIFQEILDQYLQLNGMYRNVADSAFSVVSDVLDSLISSTSIEAFEPILEALLSNLNGEDDIPNSGDPVIAVHRVSFCTRLLLQPITYSKGPILRNWGLILNKIESVITSLSLTEDSLNAVYQTLALLATTQCRAPLEAAVSHAKALRKISSGPWKPHFLKFCDLYLELDHEKFAVFLQPYLQEFINANWPEYQHQFWPLLSKVLKQSSINKPPIRIPKLWLTEVIKDLATFLDSDEQLDDVDIYGLGIKIDAINELAKGHEAGEIWSNLSEKLLLPTQRHHSSAAMDSFIFGKVLDGVSKLKTLKEDPAEIWKAICKASRTQWRREVFWKSTLEFCHAHGSKIPNHKDRLQESLLESMLHAIESPSHEMRLTVLQIARSLVEGGNSKELNLIDIALSIANTSPSLDSMRFISMQVRNLPKLYNKVQDSSQHGISDLIRAFCFGLLRVRFVPLHSDVYLALKEMCQYADGETHICEISFRWLENKPPADIGLHEDNNISQQNRSEKYELVRIEELIERIIISPPSVNDQLKAEFEQTYRETIFETPLDRTQALKVFNSIPEIAEKKSKQLVPILLDWVLSEDLADATTKQTCETILKNPWNRKDKKDLLSLFAKFKNPKALYKSPDVYNALLTLSSHADIEIQKSAFKAILTWKNKTITQYQDQIMAFFDDATFREQISVFLSIGQGEDSLRDEDRAEVMPIVLRILYGRLTRRGKGDQQSNRRAVFGLIARFGAEEANQFLDVALGPLSKISFIRGVEFDDTPLQFDHLAARKQLGFLTMVRDLLDSLGTTAMPFSSRLVDPVIYCLLKADHMALESTETIEENALQAANSLEKSNRTLAMACLNSLFSILSTFDWEPYLPQLFKYFISPRVEKLSSEHIQGVSGLLRLFATWAASPSLTILLSRYNEDLIPKLAECIGNPLATEEVKQFIAGKIILPMLETCMTLQTESSRWELDYQIGRHSTCLLEQLNLAMVRDCSKEFLGLGIDVLVHLVNLVDVSSMAILVMAAHLLQQPSRRVTPDHKTTILRILKKMIASKTIQEELRRNTDAYVKIFGVVCNSFAFNISSTARLLLADILAEMSTLDESLIRIAQLVQDMNSMSESRLDEPDFARRAKAYHTINEELFSSLSASQWTPLLGSALHFIKDADELAIRASASHTIRRFIESTSMKTGQNQADCIRVLKDIVFTSIESCIREEPEIVRIEYLHIVYHTVKYIPDWPHISDLQCLRWGGESDEEEASFFSNILHIQQHRRIRTMKRLAEEVPNGKMSGRSIAHFLVPLLEHFIFDSTDGAVAAEASKTIGVLAEWMDFPQYRSLLKRYISYIHSKAEIQETILKLLNHVTAALTRCAQMNSGQSTKSTLLRTLPSQEKLPSIVSNEFLPPFYQFLREKDESFVSRRIVAATVATRIMQILPQHEFALRFPPLLTNTCNILRSRDQASRDATRQALSEICGMVGPSSIGFVVGELRRALQKGFYLHVLGYTVHSILESTVSRFKPGDLDYCVVDIAEVIMDDVFGAAGQEKEVAEYVKNNSGNREIKGKKSFDTMQLLASVTTLPHLVELVRPIELLLLEKINHKLVRHVDELLRRTELGVVQNKSIQDRDILVFCYQVIQDAYKILSEDLYVTQRKREDDGILIPKRKKTEASQATLRGMRVAKIVRFGLELVRSVLRKHKGLKNATNVGGFLPIIRDALDQSQEEIKISAIRLFTAIVGVSHSKLDGDASYIVQRCIEIIEDSSSTNEELSQAALKLIAATLRERRSVEVSETSIALLLNKIQPDLQVINQQGVAFNLIRAIMSRKIIITEIYELIDGYDGIAAISIRDHDRTTRDLARGVYFQFLMEYPQGKKRFGKQLGFLIRNLEYEYPEGRQSVMEALNLLLTRVDDDLVKDVVREAFWPVVSIMINDPENDCRTMASGLVKTVFSRADDEWCRGFLTLLRKMLDPMTQKIQQRTALQCWVSYFEAQDAEAKDLDFVIHSIEKLLQLDEDIEESWQLRYYALKTILAIYKDKPDVVFNGKKLSLWHAIWQQLSFPHTWVKLEAAKAVDSLITQVQTTSSSIDSLPLKTSSGLKLSQNNNCELTYRHIGILKEGITLELAAQTIKNLTFLGHHLGATGLPWSIVDTERSASNGMDDTRNDSEDNGIDDEAEDAPTPTTSAIQYLFARLTTILRKESEKRKATDDEVASRRSSSLIPRMASLQVLRNLVNALPDSTILPSLATILRPLVHLTDAAIAAPTSAEEAFNESYKELVNGATELMDAIQKRIGTTEFVAALGEVRAHVAEKREERRRKRRVEAVGLPEVSERRKARKREKEKVRKREKNLVARGKRRGW
jgi:U3 small nucleolar RNA-associated protein 20